MEVAIRRKLTYSRLRNGLKVVMLVFGAISLVSCNNGRTTKQSDNLVTDKIIMVSDKEIIGQWYIRNIVIGDSLYVCPSEITPRIRQYIVFNENGTVYVKTNCNGIGGHYVLRNDSLTINNLSWTEMACDNMDVEKLLQQLLPRVCGCKVENDSILLLNTDIPCENISLYKQ